MQGPLQGRHGGSYQGSALRGRYGQRGAVTKRNPSSRAVFSERSFSWALGLYSSCGRAKEGLKARFETKKLDSQEAISSGFGQPSNLRGIAPKRTPVHSPVLEMEGVQARTGSVIGLVKAFITLLILTPFRRRRLSGGPALARRPKTVGGRRRGLVACSVVRLGEATAVCDCPPTRGRDGGGGGLA